MDSNHEETGSSGISKLLIRRSAISQESRRNDLIPTAFVQPCADRIHPHEKTTVMPGTLATDQIVGVKVAESYRTEKVPLSGAAFVIDFKS